MKSMKRSLLGLFLTAVIIFVLFVTAAPLKLDAAKCTNGKLTCEGDCCKVTAIECIAGPCDVIFPLQ